MRFINEQQRAVESMIEAMANCNGKSAYDEGVFNKNGEGLMNWITSNLNPWNRRVNDFQETQALKRHAVTICLSWMPTIMWMPCFWNVCMPRLSLAGWIL